jgi:hypothetical protein
VTAAAAKHEQLTAERILAQLPLDQRGETVEAASHVGHTGGEPDPHASSWRDHPRSAVSTRRSVVSTDTVVDANPTAIRQLDLDPTSRMVCGLIRHTRLCFRLHSGDR